MKLTKRLVKKTLRGLGYELRKISAPGLPSNSLLSDPFLIQRQIINSLGKTDICIFDVGANKGQTARRYRSKFPTAEIYCFEPFPASIAELKRQFSNDQKIHIVPKAVAQEKGVSTFYVNEFDATNSLFPRPTSDRRYYPRFAGPKGTIEVEVIGLDEFSRVSHISVIDILKL